MLVPSSPRAHRPNRGFTLIELVASAVLLTVGLLTLISTSSAIVRLETGGERTALAATLAESRVEQLRAAQCTPAVGADSVGSLVERWEVVSSAHKVGEIVGTVRIPGDGTQAPREESYRSAAPC